ncbi:FAD-dependent oxidoreductase [Polymorphobacter sp.]|uniref:FAD-dependent oxidoreductase n=1 Tax=Polymorphobacter sp. TaxID=1909290 RepID=UPI003F7128C9
MRHPVIIAGGGPTGMSAALFLLQKGIPVVVLERSPGLPDDPRAATFHPPTLEMLAPSGITGKLMDIGLIARKWQNRDRREGLVAEFDLSLLADQTPFPFRLQCEQHKLVRLLREHMADWPGLDLRSGQSIQSITQHEDHVVVETGTDRLECEWLIGADGGRSVVRKSQPIAFEGFTYPERFLVITSTHDFEADGFALSNYVADPEEWCAVFKVPDDGPPGVWRSVFPTDPATPEAALTDFESARRRLQGFVGANAQFEIVHTNLYTVHQRVADRFHHHRVLLLGDAAHLNNPLGGMGMNFGIHDAENCARALKETMDTGDAAPMARFDRQRRTAASKFLQSMTIQNKAALEETDPDVRAARRQELRDIAANPDRARAFLMRTSMIEGLREVNALP